MLSVVTRNAIFQNAILLGVMAPHYCALYAWGNFFKDHLLSLFMSLSNKLLCVTMNILL